MRKFFHKPSLLYPIMGAMLLAGCVEAAKSPAVSSAPTDNPIRPVVSRAPAAPVAPVAAATPVSLPANVKPDTPTRGPVMVLGGKIDWSQGVVPYKVTVTKLENDQATATWWRDATSQSGEFETELKGTLVNGVLTLYGLRNGVPFVVDTKNRTGTWAFGVPAQPVNLTVSTVVDNRTAATAEGPARTMR